MGLLLLLLLLILIKLKRFHEYHRSHTYSYDMKIIFKIVYLNFSTKNCKKNYFTISYKRQICFGESITVPVPTSNCKGLLGECCDCLVLGNRPWCTYWMKNWVVISYNLGVGQEKTCIQNIAWET